MTQQTVLITGASGFIGSHLAEHLSSKGLRVLTATRALRQTNSVLDKRCVAFDLQRPEDLTASALEGINCLYHLAARVHVMRVSQGDADRFHALNARATDVLARRAALAGVRRFVFLSSIKVNGERTAGRSFTMEDPPAPEDAYGCSKLAAEQALQRVADETGLEVVVVRPPLVYGPRVGANFLRLLSLVSSRMPLPLGGIDNRRSMVSVWNLVDLLDCVGTQAGAAGRTWLVSDGDDVSTPRLLRAIGCAMGRDVRLWRCPTSVLKAVGAVMGRAGEVARLVESLQVSIEATMRALEWRPPMTFDDGIGRTVEWFLEARRADT